MKYMLIFLSIVLFSFASDNTVDRLGIRGPLKFDKIKFELAWTDKPNDHYYIQEYLPKGEKAEDFTQMLTIHLFDLEITAQDAVAQKVKELNERKKTDEVCNYVVTESPDGKEFMVDFILGESKGDKMTIVEFNVYRYKQIDIGNNKKAMLVYAYTKRSYGNHITVFLKKLGDDRIEYLNNMISADMPSVTLAVK